MRHPSSVSFVLFNAVIAAVAKQDSLQNTFLKIAQNVSTEWNCSVVIALHRKEDSVSAAAGTVDFSTGKQAATTDPYVWGSVTKVITGSSILRLISEGAFGLDDEVAPLVDPIIKKMAQANPHQGFSSVNDLWGAQNMSKTTIRQLLSMTSGVPDFDTAVPCERKQDPKCIPKDPLRQLLYSEPTKAFAPAELMKVPWVEHAFKACPSSHWPGVQSFCYSSTNFMLLGLILAAQANLSTWTEFDQAEFLPHDLKAQLRFAKFGAPKNYTHVHGYDRTSYNTANGTHADHDNWEVDGVFSGWSASDLVATAPAVARLVWEIYGPPSSVAPPDFVKQMFPTGMNFYGLATMNMGHWTGQSGKYGEAFGHLGATYGYQSTVAYFPTLQVALTIATNIETDFQAQPAEALCFAYNAAASEMLGKEIKCTYESSGYYGSGCKCDPIESETSQDAIVV